MSPERDDPTDDQELYEDVPPRSIFAATWFRVVLVLIVLGVFGAVAVPYVLDWMNPPPVSRSASVKATSPVPPASPISPLPATESSASSSSSTSSSADKSSSAEKKDPTLVPAPAPPSLARPEPKSESKPTPAAKAPAPKAETKASTSSPADTTAKSSMAVTESNPKTAAKSEPPAKTESAPKPPVVAKAEPAAKDESKTAAATTAPAAKRAAAKATPPANSTSKVSAPFWVQVGAFKDSETATRVATSLRDQNFTVEQSEKQVSGKSASAASSSSGSAASSPAASPGDLYDVYVSGMSAVELTKRLSAKGLAAEGSGSSVVVKPSLPLRDAVSLSKDLAVDGLKVQVRRAGSGAVAAVPTPTTPSPSVGAGETLHRVRIGAFPDAAAARAAAKELEAKGYKPYIARGDE